MGRWRPPMPASAPYVTVEGFERLRVELKDIWPRRALVTKALAAAAAEGDRSENAEYIYRKKELAGIDRRIRYLQKRLPKLQVVRKVGNVEQIFFGARMTLQTADGTIVNYRIVGPDEIDAAKGNVSIDSPLAKALMGKRVEDEIELPLSDGPVWYLVLDIDYKEMPEQ